MIGLPHMDTTLQRLKETPELPAHPVTILLAPSWGINGISTRFGGEILKQLLATGYHVIARPHPQTMATEREMIEAIMKEYPVGDCLEWNFDNDNFEVLRRSDLLISDFSGIIFDYALVFCARLSMPMYPMIRDRLMPGGFKKNSELLRRCPKSESS